MRVQLTILSGLTFHQPNIYHNSHKPAIETFATPFRETERPGNKVAVSTFNRPFATSDHLVLAFVLMSQCGNNNELALQHSGFVPRDR